MKVLMHEEDDRFAFELEPETIAEAALLVRFGMNATKELKMVDTTAYRDGTFQTWICIGRKKQSNGSVKP